MRHEEQIQISGKVADFFDKKALRESPLRLQRIEYKGMRLYARMNEEGHVKFYLGITTLLHRVMPTPPSLIDWKVNMGKQEADRYTDERAKYGTFMHMQISALTINRKIDLEKMYDDLKEYMEQENVPVDRTVEWYDDLLNDVLAWAQFMKDTNYKPLAVEIKLAHSSGFATTLDQAAEITIEERGFFGEVYKTGAKKGQPKETKGLVTKRVIIDLKSGRKDFYESHEAQLCGQRRAWNENFKDLPISEIYNWSPKAWKTEIPTYNFKRQTETKQEEKLDSYIQLAGLETIDEVKPFKIMGGVIDLENPDLSGNIKFVEPSTFLKPYDERKN